MTPVKSNSRSGCQRAIAVEGAVSVGALIAHLVASQKIPIWVKGLETQRVLDHYEWHEVGPDHQFHCAAYARLARLVRPPIGPPLVGLISFQRGTGHGRGGVKVLPRTPWPG
jgi:hypothetical protein